MSLARRIIIVWMMAVTIHLPFPVCDGDDLSSWEFSGNFCSEASIPFDVDLILLGCALPDDVDDGPVDDDPEEGSGSSFGAYFTSMTPREFESQNYQPRRCCGNEVRGYCSLIAFDSENKSGFEFVPQQAHSFGKTCQTGLAVLRC